MGGIYFENGNNCNINKEAKVKVKRYNMNETIDIKHTKFMAKNLNNFRRISKTEYVNVITGEVKEYKQKKNRDRKDIKKSMDKLVEILKNNFNGNKNELFITLTTREQITDFDKMICYFNKFYRKLKKKYATLEYVYVIELQENRNSWHIHALIKDTKKKYLYINNEEIERFWEQGNVKVTHIDRQSIDFLGLYNNMQNNDTAIDKIVDYMTKINGKEQIAVSKKLYYKSRGIKLVEIETTTYGEIEEQLKNKYRLQNENTILVKSLANDNIINKTKTETWKQI